MRFTVLPPMGSNRRFQQWVGGGHMLDLVRTAEDVGFDAIAETDHPFPPAAFVASGGHHTLDLFVALSYAAAATTRLKVMTNIMVAGYRNPYLAAKACATLDLFSGGRLIVGMGAGYVPEEFAVLGGSFEDRGARFDEAIRAMRRAWTGQPIEGSERFFPADGHEMQPAPATPGGPPIWVGGNTDAAVRRAVELGDGWMPMAANAALATWAKTAPLEGLDALRTKIRQVQARRSELGKPPLTISSGSMTWDPEVNAHLAALDRQLPAFAEAGVHWVSWALRGRTLADCCRETELFGETIISKHRDT